MPKTAPIGHMKCPDCDFPDAEIKLDKNGRAFRFCPDCNLQTFTRKPAEHNRMIARMRPVTVENPAPENTPEPTPKPEKKPEFTPPVKAKTDFSLENL